MPGSPQDAFDPHATSISKTRCVDCGECFSFGWLQNSLKADEPILKLAAYLALPSKFCASWWLCCETHNRQQQTGLCLMTSSISSIGGRRLGLNKPACPCRRIRRCGVLDMSQSEWRSCGTIEGREALRSFVTVLSSSLVSVTYVVEASCLQRQRLYATLRTGIYF